MPTLKELRANSGLTQEQVSKWISLPASTLSLYENNADLPDLENAFLLEKKFSQKIDWPEALTPARKHEVIQSIIELCEHYPVSMAAEFIARHYRRNQYADTIIVNYAKMVTGEEALYPPETI
jgi:DNA-binding XRE family transcriptional regulator